MTLFPRPDLYRHQWIRAILAKIRPGKSILDVGCGPQPYRADCAHLKYFAQDFGKYTAKGDKGLQDKVWGYGKLDYVGNSWEIKAPKASFDYILCTEVLEHVPFPRDTVKEMGRLLKPGGTAIVTAPVNCLPHQNPYFFSHGHSEEFYQEAAKAAGMKMISFEPYSGAIDFLALETYRALRQGHWWLVLPLLPLLLASWLRIKGPDYPCFGALVILRKK